MKLLDANVVIYALGVAHPYALGVAHPYREPCRRILSALEEEGHDYLMDSETLQEILYVFDRRGHRSKGVEKVTDLLSALRDVVPIGATEIAVATRLLDEHSALSPRDAIHAAVVTVHSLEGIVSADRAFDNVEGLRRYDPGELAPGP